MYLPVTLEFWAHVHSLSRACKLSATEVVARRAQLVGERAQSALVHCIHCMRCPHNENFRGKVGAAARRLPHAFALMSLRLEIAQGCSEHESRCTPALLATSVRAYSLRPCACVCASVLPVAQLRRQQLIQQCDFKFRRCVVKNRTCCDPVSHTRTRTPGRLAAHMSSYSI